MYEINLSNSVYIISWYYTSSNSFRFCLLVSFLKYSDIMSFETGSKNIKPIWKQGNYINFSGLNISFLFFFFLRGKGVSFCWLCEKEKNVFFFVLFFVINLFNNYYCILFGISLSKCIIFFLTYCVYGVLWLCVCVKV